MSRRLIALLFTVFMSIPCVALAAADYTTDADLIAAGRAAENSGDLSTAAQDYAIAAKAGNADAQETLGGMYLSGRGEPQDCQQAVQWFDASAKQGDPQAVYNLGVLYEHGICVPQNYTNAMVLYKAAGQAGWAEAQTNVGKMYDNAEGVPRNDVEAIKWFTLAANQNNAFAQLDLGLLAWNGLGEPRDLVQADMWLNLAVKNAADPKLQLIAIEKQAALQASLTPAQIAQGNALAAAWKPPATP